MHEPPRLLKLRLRLEFEGSAFCGWQMQAPDLIPQVDGAENFSENFQSNSSHLPSVQGVIENALGTLLRREASHRVIVQGCGRTDAGVHAREFFCHFEIFEHEMSLTDEAMERFRYGLNCIINGPIAITHLQKVHASFHSLHDVSSKIYCYRILLRRAKPTLDAANCWWIPRVLSKEMIHLEALRSGLSSLEGCHDFRAFTASKTSVKSTVRRILKTDLKVVPLGVDRESGVFLELRFEGEGFLKHQVRNMVGTLMDLAQSKISLDSFISLFQAENAKNRIEAGYCAPPQGLCLEKVIYRASQAEQAP